MRRMLLLVPIFFMTLSLAAVPSGWAQNAPSTTIKGRVLDPSRAPIAGAQVTLAGASQNPPSTVTDASGEFELPIDGGDRYTVVITAPGFLELSEQFSVPAARRESYEFVLAIAAVHESVTVSATGGYRVPVIATATKIPTPLRDVPQSVTVVTNELIKDQLMTSLSDVVRYVPGVTMHQGENNRDQIIIRGNSSSADFFVNGVRDDVQYYRDVYNIDRVEALKGPNALIFGRGGAGGVINRVTKDADFRPVRELSIQGGTLANKRVTADINEVFREKIAFRLNGMYEHSGSFRDYVGLERYGVTPTVAIAPGSRTRITLRYEHLYDARVADRGITSFQGAPADLDISTFYGNPDASEVQASVNLGSADIEHRFGKATLRNHTLFGDYDRFYQNFVPGVASSDRRTVALSAYNNATTRRNVFNQTDLTYPFSTGGIRHTVLVGAEVGRQFTDNFRNTGFFDNSATSIVVPFDNPITHLPVTFRQSATDADNHVQTAIAAVYAQSHVELSPRWQALAGLRFDRFDLVYHNNRNQDTLERPDNLVSPRAGVMFKPIDPLSIYTSYGVSYVPSAGDQFSSLTAVTQQLKPERIANYEVGAKWDLFNALSLTNAIYRLDRTNTRSTDPNDPTRIVQTGSQRSNGLELGANGRVTPAWSIAGGYAHQDAIVTRATAVARAGAQVGQVPHHSFSLWNTYAVRPRVRTAIGIIYRSDMFAAIDNTVMLPGYIRADAAVYFSVAKALRIQINAENVFDRRYYVNADNNTNISPGAPRTVRVGLTTVF